MNISLFQDYLKPANVKKIILVANVYGKTEHYISSPEQLKIEFFNEREMNEIKISLREEGYDFLAYYDEHEFISDVENHVVNPDEDILVFNLARNGYGVSKKSLIPTFCDYYKIKYTGSNGYTCSLARNKHHVSNLLLQNNSHGLKTWVYEDGWQLGMVPDGCMEVIIKPLFESASKGIRPDCIINTSSINFENKVREKYLELKSPLVVEQFIHGYECKVPIFVLDNLSVCDPIGISINGNQNLDKMIITQDLSYHYSYDNYALSECFSNSVIEEIKEYAGKVFEFLGMENYGRIDCRVTPNGEFYFNDYATMPYFTHHSEMFYLFGSHHLSQGKLFNVIFNSALITKYHYNV